ncbi:HEPN domain-containing protein [Sinorhizobium medicae]|uniref:HEPN domain-containing protein n=1 Tax=Sinorhizobium medicae TaxID=110321 RepID=UPI000FD942D9|nr:HEPN domain-containing protein [Sinorhizobium medicae]RVI59071.1 hypothetical protein CN192_05795 [Sinorhizobium medicae]
MTTDEELTELIEKLRETAALSLQIDRVAQGHPVIWEVAAPLHEAIDRHPDFAQPVTKCFLGKQISFEVNPSVILLRYAARNGAAETLAWYRRVAAIESTKMRVVGQVFGLHVHKRHTFSNGVTLLRISDLPDSPNSLLLKQSIDSGLGYQYPAAVMFELNEVRNEHDTDDSRRGFLEVSEIMRKTVGAFALAGDAYPTLAESWQEFVDPDLEAAETGRSFMRSFDEGQLPAFGMNVTQQALAWVEKYLQLPGTVASACDVSIARLNLANRRVSAGDKAIDGSICLEALLSGRGRGELAHRLSVRVALLLGRSLEERQQIAKRVRAFYELRSNLVHGNVLKNEMRNEQIAMDGLSLCLAAIREVVMRAEVPDPELWELTGGPPWNRYAEHQTEL